MQVSFRVSFLFELNLKFLIFVRNQNSLCWTDEQNTFQVIRKAYGKWMTFPFSIIKLKFMSMWYESLLASRYNSDFVTLEIVKQQVCFNIIIFPLWIHPILICNILSHWMRPKNVLTFYHLYWTKMYFCSKTSKLRMIF